jgi:hypothetical protein
MEYWAPEWQSLQLTNHPNACRPRSWLSDWSTEAKMLPHLLTKEEITRTHKGESKHAKRRTQSCALEQVSDTHWRLSPPLR